MYLFRYSILEIFEGIQLLRNHIFLLQKLTYKSFVFVSWIHESNYISLKGNSIITFKKERFEIKDTSISLHYFGLRSCRNVIRDSAAIVTCRTVWSGHDNQEHSLLSCEWCTSSTTTPSSFSLFILSSSWTHIEIN